jgi:hypothetical protein
MNRTKSLIAKIAFIGICAATLGGCYVAPAPYAYGPPAYGPAYYGAPVYGQVDIGVGGGHGHWR